MHRVYVYTHTHTAQHITNTLSASLICVRERKRRRKKKHRQKASPLTTDRIYLLLLMVNVATPHDSGINRGSLSNKTGFGFTRLFFMNALLWLFCRRC